ncbi:MAG TPA: hypothetical protein VNM91_08570 [Dehalococcoidia bacterium]|nr:hypothetical protein [Dehalococcoidia bacterium]
MGYYYQQPPDEEEKPPGCLETLVITRVVFGVLFWPVVAILLVLVDVAAIFYFLTTNPLLALIPGAITVIALAALARWDRARPHDPGERPGLPPPS